jgi:alanyl-tRNA synthetase
VRRLEAYVGIEALRFLAAERALVDQLSDALKARPEELPDRVAALVARLRVAEKELERVRASQILSRAGEFAAAAEQIDGIALAAVTAPNGISGGDLRALATEVRGRLGDGPGVVVALSDVNGVEHFVTAVNAAGQSAGLRAGELASVLAPALGARGGGKADLAQGAGGDPARVDAAFAAVRQAIAERSSS